eukprot:scaffold10813_cov65-Phaeocystis_antarctica.AAC.1
MWNGCAFTLRRLKPTASPTGKVYCSWLALRYENSVPGGRRLPGKRFPGMPGGTRVLCRLLVAQVNEVCPKHEASTRDQPICKSLGPRFEWGSVTARPVDCEHGQIALRGDIFLHSGTDMQQRAVDGARIWWTIRFS